MGLWGYIQQKGLKLYHNSTIQHCIRCAICIGKGIVKNLKIMLI